MIALNGFAVGSAFQLTLLSDLRFGHPGVTMGQPEINSGFASITSSQIMCNFWASPTRAILRSRAA